MTVPSSLPARPLALVLAAALALGAAGCGRPQSADQGNAKGTKSSARGDAPDAAADLGFPTLATKNTTRVAGADPVADAAAVSQIVFPGTRPADRPSSVTLVDAGDWRAALAASSLYAAPLRSPTLFTKGTSIPGATSKALSVLSPAGSKAAGGAQVIRVGTTAKPGLLRTTDIQAKPANAFALARKIDAFVTAARGAPTSRIMLVSADDPKFAAPAAAWAAASGDTILFTHKDKAPPDTIAAIKSHRKPTIYVLGPSSVISPKVTRQIRKLGTYHRVGGQDPVANSIGFAVYADGDFGWGATTPGHGMVLIPATADPATAAAAAPLSASGTYGPALLLSSSLALDGPLGGYLKDIQPGFDMNAARGFYNHAWLIGDTKAISPQLQAAVDTQLESLPITDKSAGTEPAQ
ncbi:hypothetical protein DSM112329_03905 [Paraconexibacter sp. AEG42_29]|uniref:Cell wall-binding repeat-containing protein n=1 Tax=Paraconexibacter sp. AEG42_29 TaxID=2997339 RepID=A0AAU7B056_9ACTN